MAEFKKAAVAQRLLAIQKALGCETVDDLAAVLGIGRSRVSNWLNGYYPPPVHELEKLLNHPEMRGLTSDWVYYGIPDAMPVGLFIRLTALAEGLSPPVAGAAEDPTPKPSRKKAAASRKASRKRATSP